MLLRFVPVLCFCLAFALAQGAYAADKGKAGLKPVRPKGNFTLRLDPVENKSLEDNSGIPKWTKKSIKLFCKGRAASVQQDEKQCMKAHEKDEGRKMTLADVQELTEFKKTLSKKAAGRAKKKGRPDNDGKMKPRTEKVPPPHLSTVPPQQPPGIDGVPPTHAN